MAIILMISALMAIISTCDGCSVTAYAGSNAKLTFAFKSDTHRKSYAIDHKSKDGEGTTILYCHFDDFPNCSFDNSIYTGQLDHKAGLFSLHIRDLCFRHQGNYTLTIVKETTTSSCILEVEPDVAIIVTAKSFETGLDNICDVEDIVVTCQGNKSYLETPDGGIGSSTFVNLKLSDITTPLANYKCHYQDPCNSQYTTTLTEIIVRRAVETEKNQCRFRKIQNQLDKCLGASATQAVFQGIFVTSHVIAFLVGISMVPIFLWLRCSSKERKSPKRTSNPQPPGELQSESELQSALGQHHLNESQLDNMMSSNLEIRENCMPHGNPVSEVQENNDIALNTLTSPILF